MRSLSLPLLLCCALAPTLPSAAFAQDYTPIRESAPFDPLPIEGTTTPVTILAPAAASSSYAVVGLPFDFFFYGQPFNRVNMSTEGYVTFGDEPGTTGWGRADLATNAAIPNTAVPNGLIAPWWDDLACAWGTMKTQAYGEPGSRWFVLEWNGCTRQVGYAPVQMQIRLRENSHVIRVYYGDAPSGSSTTTHSATVGIENPPTFDKTGTTMLTTGGTSGKYGLSACTSSCTAASWPSHEMIQYGRPTTPDLEAGRLEVIGISMGSGTIEATLVNTIANAGFDDAVGVVWDYYFSVDGRLDEEDLLLVGCRRAVPATVPGHDSGTPRATFQDVCVFDIPDPGKYRFCTKINPDGAVVEERHDNNFYCSDQAFVFGADLALSIGIEATGRRGSRTPVTVQIVNVGPDSTGEFEYTVYWRDCGGTGLRHLAYAGVGNLDGGGILNETAEVYIDSAIESTSICAELVIDEANNVPGLHAGIDTVSTCDDGSRGCMYLPVSDLRVDGMAAVTPNGCFFGEPVELELKICNDGVADAVNFGVVFNIDNNTNVTYGDTVIVALPATCAKTDPASGESIDEPSLCPDLGGGDSVCVAGVCHAPCTADEECGDQGLVCLDDPLFEVGGVRGKSCQLGLPVGECRSVSAKANIPTISARPAAGQNPDEAFFTDGAYYIGAIVDWTAAVFEKDDTNNTGFTDTQLACWTPKPELVATGLRSTSRVGADEPFPVYRTVKNDGILRSEFPYRYFISTNRNLSKSDIPLQVVRTKDGQIIGREDAGTDVIDPLSVLSGVDTVVIPAGVVPGAYYLGIVLDPDDEIAEISKDNNTVLRCEQSSDGSCELTPIEVVGSTLQIVTRDLPIATVGLSYHVQLLAAGGVGGYEWSISGGNLADDLTLDPGGLIHGTVVEQGDHAFQVTVRSGAFSDTVTLAIRAMPATGALAIITSQLPTAYVGVGYVAELIASGGVPPYVWDCEGLPSWVESIYGGTIRGTPSGAAGVASVDCSVTDETGLTRGTTYALQVMTASGLRIASSSIGPFELGVEYLATVEASGGSGTYGWEFDTATVPDGLESVAAGNKGALGGTPLVCGSFLVGVTVTDTAADVSESAELPLVVLCDTLRLSTRQVPVAVRDQDYPATQLLAEGAVRFAVAQGKLPRGLTLSETGVLSGTVFPDAVIGEHNVVIELEGEAGVTGLGALTVAVQAASLPDVVLVEKVEKGGCSASGEGSASGLLPLALLTALLLLRRSRVARSVAAALTVTLAALAPAVASAQSPDRYTSSFSDITYERLVGGKAAMTGCVSYPASTCLSPPIALPFTFKFFGVEQTHVRLDTNGALHFDANATSQILNNPIPNAASPNNFIAPWWRELIIDDPAYVRYLVRGTAPDREFVVEWLFRRFSLTDKIEFANLAEMQVSLFEDGTFAMRWGGRGGLVTTGVGVVGIEDAMGSDRSAGLLPCSVTASAPNNYCSPTDWEISLQNKEASYVGAGHNLSILETSTAVEVPAGFDREVRVVARHQGLTNAKAEIEFFISKDHFISENAHSIGRTETLTFVSGEELEVTFTATIPGSIEAGSYFLLARVDPENKIAETNELDNDGGGYRFVVLPARPDLVPTSVGGPSSSVAPGARIAVDLDVANLGDVNVDDVGYYIVLSANDMISAFDRVLHWGRFKIGPKAVTSVTDLVEIPADTPAGVYRLGALIDPEHDVDEEEERNNVVASERLLDVVVDGVRVVTQFPAALQVGAPFCVPLEAEGGDGVYTWSFEGTIPPGLAVVAGTEVDPESASLCGIPSHVGIFDFSLTVASGGKTHSMEVSLEVVAFQFELAVASWTLPVASFNVPYEAGLFASGGRPPYRWSLASGTLPVGLSLGQDGFVYGTPRESGVFSIDVQVQDADGAKVEASIGLRVAAPGRIGCSTRTLGPFELGSEIDGRLLAGGGTGSYSWKSVYTQRLGDSGALPLADQTAPPPGIQLSGAGVLGGQAAQSGRFLWKVEVSDEATNTDTCTISVEVLPGPGLTVATTVMPLALVDEEYRVQLEARGGDGNYLWTLVDPRSLPSRLDLGKNGIVYGTLTADELPQGSESRTWSFVVEVRDGQNSRGVGSMAVTLTTRKDLATVTKRTETTESGCSTTGGGLGFIALGLVLLGLRRRR